MDTMNIIVEEDTERPEMDLAWHLEQCAGILLLIEMYLGEDVRPEAVCIRYSEPEVSVAVGDHKLRFRIWERLLNTPSGAKPMYLSDFNFGTYVDTQVEPMMQAYLMLV